LGGVSGRVVDDYHARPRLTKVADYRLRR
jgi:hypothetical protein